MKKIVTAVIEDNINEVEYLLDYPEADINMTWVKFRYEFYFVYAGLNDLKNFLFSVLRKPFNDRHSKW